MLFRVVLVVALLAAGSTAAWVAGRAPESTSDPNGPIDELNGTYAGVGLGSARARVIERFGRPLSARPPAVTYSNAPSSLPSDTGRDAIYADAGFTFVDGRVASFVVYGDRARTRRGVAIGDPLVRAREVYRADCRLEPTRGEAGRISPRCQARVAPGLHLYFGGDPIGVIAVSSWPPEP